MFNCFTKVKCLLNVKNGKYYCSKIVRFWLAKIRFNLSFLIKKNDEKIVKPMNNNYVFKISFG